MKKFDVFDLVGSYHYKQVANNEKYRECFSQKGQEFDRDKFLQFLKNLEDMSEDNNTKE
jgi:hypothetical protein